MIELKKAEMIHNEEFDIEIKPYLNASEIQLIIEEVGKNDNVVTKQLLKDMLIIRFCTNIEDNIVDNLNYDLVVESGLIDVIRENVKNYYDVDGFIMQNESINRSVSKFLESISATADKAVKNMPKTPKGWEKLLGQFAEVVKKNDK